MDKIFITATDTNVGKTFISALLISGLKASYWKPIQSGAIEGTDTNWIKAVTQLPDSHFWPETYLLAEPISPHAAAQLHNIQIDLNKIIIPESVKFKPLIIEGAGGVMVPINEQALIIDLIKKLNAPVIIVANNKLGVINHTLLTLKALRSYNLNILGVILNGAQNLINKTAIENYGKVKVIAQIDFLNEINLQTLQTVFEAKLAKYFFK